VILVADMRRAHEVCEQRGCNVDAADDSNWCAKHRDDHRRRQNRSRVMKRKAKRLSRPQLTLLSTV